MNILLELADKDLIVICLGLFVIVLVGVIIFSFLPREEKEEEIEPTPEQLKAREELERVFNQMSADLENQTASSSEIETFEREQEENAIISYQELIKEAEKQIEPINTVNEPEEEKKFKNSAIISPIFGVQKDKSELAEATDEVTARHAYEKMQDHYEMENNHDFLNSLKEFRKNL